MKNLLFWLAFPFVLPQALWLRKRAPRFKDAVGEHQGEVGQGTTLRLVAIGDSIIAGVGAATLDKALVGQTAASLAEQKQASVHWVSIGKTGVTSRGLVKRLLKELPDTEIDYFVVSIGVNDVTALTSLKAWRINLTRLFESLHSTRPNAVIAFAGLPPLGRFPLLPQPLRFVLGLRAQVLDRAALSVIQGHPTAVHVSLAFDLEPENFSPDGYHPNEDSYVEYGRLVAEALVEHRAG